MPYQQLRRTYFAPIQPNYVPSSTALLKDDPLPPVPPFPFLLPLLALEFLVILAVVLVVLTLLGV